MNPTLFTLEAAVRWRDMDAFNHVNNASYLGYIEEARVLWFKSLSLDWAGESAAPILAAITVNYRRPISWPESVRIELFAERMGTKSLTLGHRISAAGDANTVYADGNAVMVWVDRSGTSVLLPESVRKACGAT
jgi:acyl-CoA thioester hydrolase